MDKREVTFGTAFKLNLQRQIYKEVARELEQAQSDGSSLEDVRKVFSKKISSVQRKLDDYHGVNKPIEKKDGKMLEKS